MCKIFDGGDNRMNKENDAVNDFGKYLKGKPAYKIYTEYKKLYQ